MLPHTDAEGHAAWPRRSALPWQTPMPTAAGDITVTVSIGLAQMEGLPGEVDQLMARADQALYEAKRGGRNQARGWR